jgi:hypothetical protein
MGSGAMTTMMKKSDEDSRPPQDVAAVGRR